MPVTQSDIPNLLKAGLKTLFFESLQKYTARLQL